jgi:hypothetical protein
MVSLKDSKNHQLWLKEFAHIMGNISITLVEVARSVVEECVGINRFERTTTIAIKLQPA